MPTKANIDILVKELDLTQNNSFHCQVVGLVKNVIVFSAGISLSRHVNTRWKDILILGDCPTYGLDVPQCQLTLYSLLILLN